MWCGQRLEFGTMWKQSARMKSCVQLVVWSPTSNVHPLHRELKRGMVGGIPRQAGAEVVNPSMLSKVQDGSESCFIFAEKAFANKRP
jgi:hypothetical protein